jgi:hypothetical protein
MSQTPVIPITARCVMFFYLEAAVEKTAGSEEILQCKPVEIQTAKNISRA